MTRILYITTLSRTINSFLVPHINMLLDSGYIVDCACCIDQEIDENLIRRGVRGYDIPFSRKPLKVSNLKAFNELINIQEERQYDIVHVHTPVASIYGRLLKLKFPGIKVVYTAHGYHFFDGCPVKNKIIYYPIERMMAKLTDTIININKEDYEITIGKFKPKGAYLVNGVGLDLGKYKPLDKEQMQMIRKELGISKCDFVIIMIAEFSKNKNHMQLIKALEIIKNKHSNIKVLCVGEEEGLFQFLKRQATARKLEDNIKFLGYRTDINELINISDIGILLSYREGLPRSIMELMANGKRVIATNVRGNRDLVSSEAIGTLVNIGDIEATVNAIENYYLDRNRKDSIPNEIEFFDLNNILGQLKDIYNSI